MRKHLFPVLVISALIPLSGCTVYRKVNLQNMLEKKITEAEKATVFEPDHQKKFYSYYISPQIGRMEGDSTGNIFNYQGTRFLMNLNVSSIINRKYYQGIENDSDILNQGKEKAYLTGNYRDLNGDVHSFSTVIYDIGNQNYLTAMRTDTVDFCSVSDALKAVDTAGEMLRIARSVEVNTDQITAAYSRKETVVFTGEKIQLFDSVAPESGRVEELFEDKDNITQSPEASPEAKASGKTPVVSQSPSGE